MAWVSAGGFLALCLLSSSLPLVVGHSLMLNKRFSLEPVSKFWLKRVTKEEIPNGHQFQLYFQGQAPNVVMFNRDTYQSQTLEVGPDGVVKFNSSAKTGECIPLLFQHPSGLHCTSIRVQENSPSEQVIPTFNVHVEGGSSLRVEVEGGTKMTFQEGDDNVVGNFSLKVDPESNLESPPSLRVSMAIKSESEIALVRKYRGGGNSPFQIIGEENLEKETTAVVRVNSSDDDVGGVLRITGKIKPNCEQGCLLKYYIIKEDVAVYRQGEYGPFPENFIGIVTRRSSDTPTQQFCSLHESHVCGVFCEVMGDHPSPVQIFRVQPSGELVESSTMSLANDGYWAVGGLWFRNATVADAGYFRCVSRSGSVEFLQTIHFSVGYDALIIHRSSTVRRSEDGSVEVTCRAKGDPLPTVFFKDSNDVPVEDGESEALDVTVTDLDDSTTEAVLSILDPSLVNSLHTVKCHAENTIDGILHTSIKTFDLLEYIDNPHPAVSD